MKENFYVGQIFEDIYPVEAAKWCNANNAYIEEIDQIEKEVEETYTEIETVEKEVVIPATEDEPEHTEIVVEEVPVEKTRTVTATVRRFEIMAVPEPTVDEKKAAVRAVRDQYINDIEWRVSRYRDQKEIEIPTTDDEETYHKILQYMQYLRDYPESSWNWYEQNPMTWDEWSNNN